MAVWEEVTERLGGSAGLGIGIAAAVLAPTLAPVLGRGLRSLVKSGIKGYLWVTEQARSAVAEAGERLQDLYAEAKAELESAHATAQSGPAASESASTSA